MKSWSDNDHIRHYLYESVYGVLSQMQWDRNRQYDILDFGSKWYGDPDGGWQTFMRWMFKDLVGTENINHILGTFPEYNVENLSNIPTNSLDVVIADQVLEHVERPWLAAPEIHRVLKPGGVAMVATPGMYPIHPSPLDCWRIMPDGYRVLFPDANWQTLVLDFWGNADRVAYEYTHNKEILNGAPTFTSEEALEQPHFTRGNDGKCPLQVWWVGRKR